MSNGRFTERPGDYLFAMLAGAAALDKAKSLFKLRNARGWFNSPSARADFVVALLGNPLLKPFPWKVQLHFSSSRLCSAEQ